MDRLIPSDRIEDDFDFGVPRRSPARPKPVMTFKLDLAKFTDHLADENFDEVSSQEFPFHQYGQSPQESVFSVPPTVSENELDDFSDNSFDEILEEMAQEYDPFEAQICTISDVVTFTNACLSSQASPKLVCS